MRVLLVLSALFLSVAFPAVLSIVLPSSFAKLFNNAFQALAERGSGARGEAIGAGALLLVQGGDF
jgi:hypothetical protein